LSLGPGTRLGPYEVIAQIGAGGMGEVYRARDTKLNRDVALKVLPEAFAADSDRLARFKREAQVLASLNDPHIAAIYGFEDSGSTHALVLELVEGPTLADRIARGPLAVDEAIAIAKQIAEALEAAHEQGIIHRDLKPANIKVRDDGTVKVLDFGLAKAMEPASAISPMMTNSPTITTPAMVTGVGTLLGTAAYMSPEQAKGRPADKRSDVWAFGCVLYEMLTGKRAFEGEDVSDTLANVLKGEPDWNVLPKSLPSAVHLLIRRCLTKDRQQRIADMAVAQFVIAEPVSFVAFDAPADSSARRPRWVSSVILTGAIVLTAIVASVVAWRVKPQVGQQVVRFSIVSTKDDPLANAGRQLVAISPDGTQVVYATSGRSRLFLRSLSTNEGHAIPGTEGRGVHSPAFSPDGHELVYFDNGTLKRVAVSGGAPVPVCAPFAPFGVTWDASGVIFGQGRRGIFRCSPNGGMPEQLITVRQDEFAHGPQLLPDGDHLLFTIAKADNTQTQWDRAQIVVQSLKSGQRTLIVNNGSDGRYLPTGHLLYAVGGVAMAIAFDPDRLKTSGAAVSVISGVARARGAATGMSHMAVASSGTLVYVPGPPDPTVNLHQLALATQDGVVTALKVPPGPYTHVRASHDGKQLAVGSDDGKEASVWIYDLSETTAIRRLTLEGRNRFPIWSPSNQQRIAFQSDRDGDFAIFTQLTNGTGPVERLTKPQKGERHFPGSWSTDGKHLAFTVEKEGEGYSLWILSLPDRKTTRFGQVSSIEPIEPVFSPDDRWIAYTSVSAESAGRAFTQNRGVFIEPFPWTGSRYQAPKLQIDFHPLWSADRRWLFYTRTAASGELTAVPVSLGPDVKFGTPDLIRATVTGDRLSNESRAFDVLPDGRFAGLTTVGGVSVGANPELRLDFALNWFEELKQRVPSK
jgi:serine/threonine-protein kinase